jgi:hypothetical protein
MTHLKTTVNTTTTISTSNKVAQLKTQRLYRQVLCQAQYTQLPYSVQAIYKFALVDAQQVPQVKALTWAAFRVEPAGVFNTKKPARQHQLWLHFLFSWFQKQLLPVEWHSTAEQWQATAAPAGLGFYLLRYNFLAQARVYPFVPTANWAQLHPRQLTSLPWTRLLDWTDLPLPLEDYLTLEAEQYRCGFRLRCHVPTTLPRWYTKVFTLRSHHYPTVYEPKLLPVLQGLSLVPLKTPYLFDELATARFSMDTRKKRLLMIFKALLKLGRQRKLITEYALAYRLHEQLYSLAEQSPAAHFFQTRWFSYFNK